MSDIKQPLTARSKEASLETIKRESVKEQVFAQLRDQIMKETWKAGCKIPSENELAEGMGVSRVSVREGLQMLVTLGLLETRHGEGHRRLGRGEGIG